MLQSWVPLAECRNRRRMPSTEQSDRHEGLIRTNDQEFQIHENRRSGSRGPRRIASPVCPDLIYDRHSYFC